MRLFPPSSSRLAVCTSLTGASVDVGGTTTVSQLFAANMNDWDPKVTNGFAAEREVILFDNAGVGRSSGTVPETVAGMAQHTLAFLDGMGLTSCDVLGFSLGGMVAQQMVESRPSIFRKMILVGTGPRGGEDIMHLEKPSLAKYLADPKLRGYALLPKIFFAPTESSQKAGRHLLEGWHNGRKTWSPPPDRRLPQPKWQRFVSGSNFLESALRT